MHLLHHIRQLFYPLRHKVNHQQVGNPLQVRLLPYKDAEYIFFSDEKTAFPFISSSTLIPCTSLPIPRFFSHYERWVYIS